MTTPPEVTGQGAGPVFGSQAADNAVWDEVAAAVRASGQLIADEDVQEVTAAVVPILARLVDSVRTPAVTGQGEGGEVLGEEANAAILTAVQSALGPGSDYRLIGTARADGIEEGRGDMEHLERKWRAEERERIALYALAEMQKTEANADDFALDRSPRGRQEYGLRAGAGRAFRQIVQFTGWKSS